MKRTKLILLTLASACLLFASSTRAALINGDFEAGLAGWIVTDPTVVPVGPADTHTGIGAARFGPVSGTLEQAFLAAAGLYALDFWAKDDGGGAGQAFVVRVDGGLVTSINPGLVYANSGPFVLALGAGLHTLSFEWLDGPNNAFLDDVRLVPVPEPGTMVAGALLLLPFALSTVRRLRKNRVA